MSSLTDTGFPPEDCGNDNKAFLLHYYLMSQTLEIIIDELVKSLISPPLVGGD